MLQFFLSSGLAGN